MASTPNTGLMSRLLLRKSVALSTDYEVVESA